MTLKPATERFAGFLMPEICQPAPQDSVDTQRAGTLSNRAIARNTRENRRDLRRVRASNAAMGLGGND